MSSKRLLWIGLLIGVCISGWCGYGAVHRAALNHRLVLASASGNPEMVRPLLEQGADPNAREDSSLQTAWERFLNLFLHRRQVNAYLCPLSQALVSEMSTADRVAMVRLLLEHGADPNLKLPGETPLPIRAITMGTDDRVPALFLEHGADPNTIDQAGVSLSSMLMYAVHARRWALAQNLLDHGAKPDFKNANGDSALMWVAYDQNLGMLKRLLSHGADVNHKNNKGQTALIYALAHSGGIQNAILESLLAAGADVNTPDAQGCSPFLMALIIHNPAVDSMLAHGGDVRKAIPLSAPTQSLFINLRLEYSATMVNMATTVTPGTTPLMFAVRAQDAGLVGDILAKRADVNAQDATGRTAMDDAENGSAIRAMLVRAGAR